MENQFQRTEILIGKENLEKIKQSKITWNIWSLSDK